MSNKGTKARERERWLRVKVMTFVCFHEPCIQPSSRGDSVPDIGRVDGLPEASRRAVELNIQALRSRIDERVWFRGQTWEKVKFSKE